MTENVIVITPLLGIHFIAAIGALMLGIVQIFLIPRGTSEHKKIGRFWVALMAVVAFTSIFDLLGDGALSSSHVFTVGIFILLPLSVWAARSRKIKIHKYGMITSFVILVVAFVALLAVPGRLLNQWFFGG